MKVDYGTLQTLRKTHSAWLEKVIDLSAVKALSPDRRNYCACPSVK